MTLTWMFGFACGVLASMIVVGLVEDQKDSE